MAHAARVIEDRRVPVESIRGDEVGRTRDPVRLLRKMFDRCFPLPTALVAALQYEEPASKHAARSAATVSPAMAPAANDAHDVVLAIFLVNVLRGEPVTIHGDGGQTRDFVHIDDVVEAWIRVVGDQASDGAVLKVGSGHETSVNALADAVLAALGESRDSWRSGATMFSSEISGARPPTATRSLRSA
jgi:nucleoside-diphosphate-sugar epimerase